MLFFIIKTQNNYLTSPQTQHQSDMVPKGSHETKSMVKSKCEKRQNLRKQFGTKLGQTQPQMGL